MPGKPALRYCPNCRETRPTMLYRWADKRVEKYRNPNENFIETAYVAVCQVCGKQHTERDFARIEKVQESAK